MKGFYAIVALSAVMAVLGGYLVGQIGGVHAGEKGTSTAGANSASDAWNVRGVRGNSEAAGERRIPLTLERREALKDNLRKEYHYSPSPARDWMLRQKTAAVLSEFTNAGLETFAREVNARAGYEEKTNAYTWGDGRRELLDEICRQWALRDPAACLEAVEIKVIDRQRIFRDWVLRDAAAAEAWLDRQPDLPDRESYREALEKRNR